MKKKQLDDNELLYLRVRNIKLIEDRSKHDYAFDSEGNIIIRPYAFRDPRFQTSVDRACINDFDPEVTKNGDVPEFRETDGVIGIFAGDINSDELCLKIGNRKVSVIEDEIPSNLAHAKIVARPDFSDKENPIDGTEISDSQRKKQFRKLREKDADSATEYIRDKGWELEPIDPDVINENK